uniref:Cytochrome c oxidase assembly factor COX18 n=1 Tax=Neogobius melanostomus TaxID=47308 RepID=A0A8C6S2M5_9GOBI
HEMLSQSQIQVMLRLLRPAVRLSPSPLSLAPPLHAQTPALVQSSHVHMPVHVAEQFLVGFQELSGAPWWLSIAAATLTVRSSVTLPLAAYQTVVASLQKEISELSQRLRYEVSVRAKELGWNERTCRFQFKKNMRRIVSELYIRDNCHPYKASILVLVQVPVWISLSLAFRELSLDSSVYSALAAGGALWFRDLTVPDSTWIIPVSLGLTNLLLVRWLASLQQKPVSGRFQKVLLHSLRAVSLLMIPVSAYVPTCMSLYWLCSSVVGLGHNMILRSTKVQTLLRVPTKSSSPYRDLYAAFVTKYLPHPGHKDRSGLAQMPSRTGTLVGFLNAFLPLTGLKHFPKCGLFNIVTHGTR